MDNDDFERAFHAVPYLRTYSPEEQIVIRVWMRVGWDAAMKARATTTPEVPPRHRNQQTRQEEAKG